MSKQFDYTIQPPSRWPTLNAHELWRFRDLFLVLTYRDIAVRYKQTVLGGLWAMLQPFVQMVVFTFVFNRLGNISSGSLVPYPIFLYVGLLFWQFYATTLTNASNSLIANASIVQKVYFPRLILPSTTAITSLVDLSFSTLIFIGVLWYYHYIPSLIGLVLLPVILGIALLSSLGLGLFFAAVNVKYRDVRYVVPFLTQTLMYLTPVIYPVQLLDGMPMIKTIMLWANPISGAISVARTGLLGTGPIEWSVLGISFLMSLVLFLVGLAYFRHTEYYFADVA